LLKPKLLLFTILLLFMFNQRMENIFAAADDQEEKKVDFVEVQLDIDGKIYEGLQDRIEFSIAKVGEKILLDQPVTLLTKNKATVQKAIYNVFSKVLVGFKLESVDLFLGEHTKIVMHITPIPPFISNLRINLKTPGLNPELNKLTGEVVSKVEKALNQIFVGLPVSSISWSSGIFNTVVNYLIERELPGFDSSFSIQEGTTTEINLTLIPQGAVVSNITVNYATTNIPVLLVKTAAKQYQDKAELLKGIPVEFLTHYRTRLEKYLTENLNDFSELRKLGFITQLSITPGEETRVILHVTSRYVQTRVEGRYFLGHEETFGNIQAYLGYRMGALELYSKYFWGDNPSGVRKAGCAFPIDDNLTGGFEYEFEHPYRQVWLHYRFERGDYLDMKLGLNDSPNEATIGIYLNPSTNLEVVNYQKDFGLQLMFHF
jgi:hypothetical protein